MTLAALLQAHREDVISRFVERLRGSQAPQQSPASEIIDSLPQFVDEVRAALEAGGKSPLPETSLTAREHGKQRYRSGFSVDSIAFEYGILRDIVLDLADETGVAITSLEHRILSRSISTAVAEAVRQFAQERDEAMRRQSNEHFAFLAHEIRNPLHSSRLALGLLARRHPEDASVAMAERGLSRVSELIDEALASSRMEAARSGSRPLQLERVALAELLQNAVDESSLDALHRRLHIALECPPDVRADVDRRLLRSAVTNLLRNAIKFSRDGGTVVLRCNAAEGRVLIEVEDECGGLPPGTLQRLFTPFEQSGRDRSGFGLGLAIARQAVEAHAGSLQARDLPGKGCVFLIGLPAAKGE